MNNTVHTWEFVEDSPYMRSLHHNLDGSWHVVFSRHDGGVHMTRKRKSMREAADEARAKLRDEPAMPSALKMGAGALTKWVEAMPDSAPKPSPA